MELALDILTVLLLLSGSFFAITAAVGILRMPDFYSRTHPASKSDTLAQLLIITGLFLQTFDLDGFSSFTGIKLFLIVAALFITAPTAVHAITKAAHVDRVEPWRKRENTDV